MIERKLYIYDLETYPNLFLAVFKNVDTKKIEIFEISDRKNELASLRRFLDQKGLRLIGFNNINFDYPLLHSTILNKWFNCTSGQIFKKAQEIISADYSAIRYKEVIIPQLDLYKIWHYDNKNKATSLKWLEYAMREDNVEDLPYNVGSVLSEQQMDHVVEYCINDINATESFYKKSTKHIELRKYYTKHEGIDLMNASEIRMSKEIFAKYLSKEMGESTWDIKKLRTNRKSVDIKDVVFDYIDFDDEINQQMLKRFKSYTWYDTTHMSKKDKEKSKISFNVRYQNVVREYAIGGLHSFGKPGIYESDNEYILLDVDFASYYPHLSFKNGLHPAHIPAKIFNKIYENFYFERKKYPKSDPRNYVLKIVLNGSYGLSKDRSSFLYDPKWQLEICINGQLLLTLLTEKIIKNCKKDVQIIFENTDGAMYRIHRSDYNLLTEACKEVEKLSKIPLEIQECKKIIARDVNNYINIIDDKNIKFKGCFEIDRDYHKNHSKRIVPITLGNYYIHGCDIVSTIKNHLKGTKYDFAENYGIFDFCHGVKMIGQNKLYKREIQGVEIVDTELRKMNRYYVSNDGYELIKKLPPLEKNKLTSTDKMKLASPNQINIFDFIEDNITIEPSNRETNIEAGWKCILYNKHDQNTNYDINYDYYVNEVNKIIEATNG